MTPATKHVILLLIVNIPVYIALGKLVFGSWQGFREIVDVSTPTEYERRSGLEWLRYLQHPIESIKGYGFFFLCIGVVAIEYHWFF